MAFQKRTIEKANKIISRYNSKISRLNKKGNNTLLPNKITKQDALELITRNTTTRDLNRELRALERFISKGGEKVVTYQGEQMLKADKDTLIALKRSATRKINYEIKLESVRIELPVSFTREQLEMLGGKVAMLSPSLNNLIRQAKIISTPVKGQAIDEVISNLFNVLKETEHTKLFQDNFIQILAESNYLVGNKYDTYHPLLEKIRGMTPRQFYELYVNNQKAFDQILYGYHLSYEISFDTINTAELEKVSDGIESLINIVNA